MGRISSLSVRKWDGDSSAYGAGPLGTLCRAVDIQTNSYRVRDVGLHQRRKYRISRMYRLCFQHLQPCTRWRYNGCVYRTKQIGRQKRQSGHLRYASLGRTRVVITLWLPVWGAAGSSHSDGAAAHKRPSGTSAAVPKPAPTPLWVAVSRRGRSYRSGVVKPVHPRRAALSTRYGVLADPAEGVSDPDVSAAARPAPRHDGGRSTPRVANSLIKSGHGSENSSVY